MLRKELSIFTLPNGTITVEIHGLSDAIELQNSLGRSIQMAIADGKTGRDNGIPARSEDNKPGYIRFQVNISNHESNVIGFNTKI